MHYTTILNQLQDMIPRYQFETLTKQHEGDAYVKKFTCWHQLTVLLYAQASGKDSLRDISQGLLRPAAEAVSSGAARCEALHVIGCQQEPSVHDV